MKLTAAGIAKIVAAAVAAAGSAGVGATVASSESRELQKQILARLSTIESDVRLLKCANDFPGECPGQAKAHAR